MSNKRSTKELLEEIYDYPNEDRGKEARIIYEVKKIETERRRNIYIFIITILLSVITILDITLKGLEFISK